jgi:hypothetical protein
MKLNLKNLKSAVMVLSTMLLTGTVMGQAAAWQQRVSYVMDIDMDANKHQYAGKQTLTYTNNSMDTLNKVFYHLYFNAFQPGSMMDVRSRSIVDPDERVGDRISKLTPDEIGYIMVKSLMQDGKVVRSQEVVATVLEVTLDKAILPGQSTVLSMEWDAQVPLQIRRSGRDNAEGVEFSMAQWYPKMAEYDAKGWHADPYVGREFYAVWGDFDVTIHMDKKYLIGGTGVLQNPKEIGFNYGGVEKVKTKEKKLHWHFEAKNVHDFVWAADPDYIHDVRKCASGLELHFIYQDDDDIKENWKNFQPDVERLFDIAIKNYGKYAFSQYSVIQGGDGGMEYPMATLITGKRKYSSLLGVTVHEAMHSWYQMMLATDEGNYPWMDEGFTSYASSEIMAVLNDSKDLTKIHDGAHKGYAYIVGKGLEEPLCTHGDHYETNVGYGIASYNKGELFVDQLGYVIGKENLDKTLLRYFNEWAFKHPDVYDFIRVAEKVSDLELDWYVEYFVNTTKTIDYAITGFNESNNKTAVELKRIGQFIMPIDVVVTAVDGARSLHTIPLGIMRGAKQESFDGKYVVEKDWFWTNPEYTFTVDMPMSNIRSIEIDPSLRMADLDPLNNVVLFKDGKPQEQTEPNKE